MRALVVDDSRVMRKVLGRYLGSLGFTVTEAADGREALSALAEAESRPDKFVLILVDWNMPELNGYDLVKAIRANRSWADAVVVMVTAENDQRKIAKSLMAGADEYVMKPFTEEALRSKLRLVGLGS